MFTEDECIYRFCFCSSNQTGKQYFSTLVTVFFYYFFFLVFILIELFLYIYISKGLIYFCIAFAYHLHVSFKVTHPPSESFCLHIISSHFFHAFCGYSCAAHQRKLEAAVLASSVPAFGLVFSILVLRGEPSGQAGVGCSPKRVLPK